MTSKLNPTHFGRHRFKFTPERIMAIILSTILDPYWVHRMLWYTVEAWMEQFEPSNIETAAVAEFDPSTFETNIVLILKTLLLLAVFCNNDLTGYSLIIEFA